MPQLLNTEMIRTLKSVFMPLPANLGARVYGSAQDVDNAAYDAITFDTERWDTGSTGVGGSYPDGIWKVANPDRLTAVYRGWHTISGHIELPSLDTSSSPIMRLADEGYKSYILYLVARAW